MQQAQGSNELQERVCPKAQEHFKPYLTSRLLMPIYWSKAHGSTFAPSGLLSFKPKGFRKRLNLLVEVGTNLYFIGTCIEGWNEFMAILAIYHSSIWGNNKRYSETELAVPGLYIYVCLMGQKC